MSAEKPVFTASKESREEQDNDRIDLAGRPKEVPRLPEPENFTGNPINAFHINVFLSWI